MVNNTIEKAINMIETGRNPTIWFDLDGTIANTKDVKYDRAEIIESMLALAKYLKSKGCKIGVRTARGGRNGLDYRKLTELQLKEWSFPYDYLEVGKVWDLYIGDEALRPEEALELIGGKTNEI